VRDEQKIGTDSRVLKSSKVEKIYASNTKIKSKKKSNKDKAPDLSRASIINLLNQKSEISSIKN
jgi:hypothetical protein